MTKTLALSIISVGFLAACGGGGGGTSSNVSNNWAVLKSNTANGDAGYVSFKQNGTTETLVASGVDVDTITPEPVDITINSLNFAQNYANSSRYSGSVDVNGNTITGYVLTGINQTDSMAVIVTPGSLTAELASAIGPTVTNMPVGFAIYSGESLQSWNASSSAVGYPVQALINFNDGTGILEVATTWNIAGGAFEENITVNLNSGDFSGAGGSDNNGLAFNTYGSITGANGEALVGSFDGTWIDGSDIIGAYVAEKR